MRAIIQAEASRRMYQNIREIMGKQNLSLTQIEIDSPEGLPSCPSTTLTSKTDIEEQLIQHNCRHSLQSLSTPFMKKSS